MWIVTNWSGTKKKNKSKIKTDYIICKSQNKQNNLAHSKKQHSIFWVHYCLCNMCWGFFNLYLLLLNLSLCMCCSLCDTLVADISGLITVPAWLIIVEHPEQSSYNHCTDYTCFKLHYPQWTPSCPNTNVIIYAHCV